jgi:Ca2+-binding EF-hand superfamily protein
MDQIISYNELAKILRDFSIVIPNEKINQILTYIEVNKNSFSLNDISNGLKKCKILASETSTEEIIKIINRLKDIIFTLGGESFFFNSNLNTNTNITSSEGIMEKDSLSKKKFISLLKSKEVNVQYSSEILETIFNFLTKTERNLSLEEFRKHFIDTKKNKLDEEFEIIANNKFNQKISKMSVRPNEYYDTLLLKKLYRVDNNFNRLDFHRVLNLEGYDFTAEEIDFIFRLIDTKKDNLIDREEFLKFVQRVHNALYKIKDLIKHENLEIEDILYKMNINKFNEKLTKRFDFLNFKMSKEIK